MWGADSSHAAGSTIEAGLPNITGMLGDSNGNFSLFWGLGGAFYGDNDGNKNHKRASLDISVKNTSPSGETRFDASRSSSIYGNSDTVTSLLRRSFLATDCLRNVMISDNITSERWCDVWRI